MTRQTILLTVATGFIGRHLAEQLEADHVLWKLKRRAIDKSNEVIQNLGETLQIARLPSGGICRPVTAPLTEGSVVGPEGPSFLANSKIATTLFSYRCHTLVHSGLEKTVVAFRNVGR